MARFGLATLNHSPLHGLPTQLEAHLDAAAAAGFDDLAPDVFWLRALEGEGVAPEAVRDGLDARGLGCLEIAGIAIGAEEATRAEVEEQVRHAEVLGAAFVNARVVETVDGDVVARARTAAEAFARVGTRMALEFSRGTQLRSVAEAQAFVEAVDVPGVGVTLDTWHFFLRPEGVEWDALDALPPALFANVQLSDGVPYEEGAFGAATMDRRRMPGAGGFALDRFVSAVEASFGRSEVPVVVEVLDAETRAGAVATYAQAARDAASACWASAV